MYSIVSLYDARNNLKWNKYQKTKKQFQWPNISVLFFSKWEEVNVYILLKMKKSLFKFTCLLYIWDCVYNFTNRHILVILQHATKWNFAIKFVTKNYCWVCWACKKYGSKCTVIVVTSRPAAVTSTISTIISTISTVMVLIVAIVVTIITSSVIIIHLLLWPATTTIIMIHVAMITLLLLLLRRLLLLLLIWSTFIKATSVLMIFIHIYQSIYSIWWEKQQQQKKH